MKLAILCRDGSPLGVTMQSIFGEDGRVGVGGAELGLLTLCEAWHQAKHEVVLFNDGNPKGSPFEHRGKETFRPFEGWDAVIVFRSPNHHALAFPGPKIWLSCDQFTIDNYSEFAPMVDKIVTISPFHAQYFKRQYHIQNSIVIDLPIRTSEYAEPVEKVKGRCLFASVPDRGLGILHAAWPLIKRDCPEASLVITSDYRLWGCESALNEQYRMRFAFHEGVKFLGAINRQKLIEEQLKSQVLSYPCIYEELFCLAVAESECAGAIPITSSYGAIPTTNMGIVLEGEPQRPEWVEAFKNKVIETLRDPNLVKRQEDLRQKSLARFNPQAILAQWDKKVFA